MKHTVSPHITTDSRQLLDSTARTLGLVTHTLGARNRKFGVVNTCRDLLFWGHTVESGVRRGWQGSKTRLCVPSGRALAM